VSSAHRAHGRELQPLGHESKELASRTASQVRQRVQRQGDCCSGAAPAESEARDRIAAWATEQKSCSVRPRAERRRRQDGGVSWAWHLRPIAEADRDWAFALHKESLGDYVIQTWGWDETAQRAMFDEAFEGRPRQIIEIDPEAVGVLEIEQRPEELYLALIELAAEWRERGLGSEIVGSLIAQAQSSGRPLSLHVLKANSRAISFYERLGLDIIGVETLKLRLRTR
jgi:ribosomal protein S18 acetylase RimI-like enzyme